MVPHSPATRRWLTVLAGCNPLVRRSDRWEALILVALMLAGLLSLSVAAAVGTAVYDSSSRAYAQERQTRLQVAATIVEQPADTMDRNRLVFTAPVAWRYGGAAHTDSIQVPPASQPGDTVDIWVDRDGLRTEAPKPSWVAAVDGVLAAVASWLGIAAVLGALAALIHAMLSIHRARDWERELAGLVDGHGGLTGSPS